MAAMPVVFLPLALRRTWAMAAVMLAVLIVALVVLSQRQQAAAVHS